MRAQREIQDLPVPLGLQARVDPLARAGLLEQSDPPVPRVSTVLKVLWVTGAQQAQRALEHREPPGLLVPLVKQDLTDLTVGRGLPERPVREPRALLAHRVWTVWTASREQSLLGSSSSLPRAWSPRPQTAQRKTRTSR